MIREPYNLNPYNSTIDTSKVNNFSFTFSGDELGSWNIEIAKNNTSPEIVYTSEEFVPEDVGYTHIYDDDIVEGITLPSTIAHSQGDDGLLRRLYSINGYPFNAAVVKLNVNGIENIGNIKGSTANGYLVATNYSLGRAGSNVTIVGFDKDGTTIGSQVTDGTYDFLGYLLSVKENSNIEIGQVVQIEGNSFVIGNIEDAGDGYSELTIVNGEATISDVAPIVTFDSLAEADVTELTVGIEPVQDLSHGDPSPSNICPITGHDSVNVYSTGKNLNPWQGVNYSASASRTIWLNEGTYILSTDNGNYLGGNNAIYFAHYDANGNNITEGAISSTQLTLNGVKTFYYGSLRSSYVFTILKEGLYSFGFNNVVPSNVGALQLELGSTATSYEPYRSNTYTTSLGQTVYGGTLDMVTGQLVVDRGLYTVTNVSQISGNGSKVGTYPKWLLALNNIPNVDPSYYNKQWSAQDAIICNMGSMVRESESLNTNETTMSVYFHATMMEIRLRPLESDFPTLEEAKQVYVGAEFVYPITPTTYQLTAQQIKTLVGTNNVWASSGDIVSIKFKYNTN